MASELRRLPAAVYDCKCKCDWSLLHRQAEIACFIAQANATQFALLERALGDYNSTEEQL